MKKSSALTLASTLAIVLLLWVIVFAGNGIYRKAVENEKTKQENTAVYFVELPNGLDTMDFKVNITLNREKEFHQIKFPNGGTETNVSIFDSIYLDHIKKNTIVRLKPLTEGTFSGDREVFLDISTIPPGKYFVHYRSCHVGGIFSLNVN